MFVCLLLVYKTHGLDDNIPGIPICLQFHGSCYSPVKLFRCFYISVWWECLPFPCSVGRMLSNPLRHSLTYLLLPCLPQSHRLSSLLPYLPRALENITTIADTRVCRDSLCISCSTPLLPIHSQLEW